MSISNQHKWFSPAPFALAFACGLLFQAYDSFAAEASAFFDTYEPNYENPFGQLNPDASDAVADYSFMVGEWLCDERLRQNGEWSSYPSSMRAQYYLNGHGVINFTWTALSASSMAYQYDEARDTWTITNTVSPTAAHTVWSGQREGDARVASLESTGPDGRSVTLRITFDNVTAESFDWRLEALPPSGPFLLREKTCRRA